MAKATLLSREQPAGSLFCTHYAEFEDMVRGFAEGALNLVVCVAPPGLGKSQCVSRSLQGMTHLYVKGRKTPLDFYMDLYRHADKPIVLDDTDSMMRCPVAREYLKILTETDEVRTIKYGTTSRRLEDEGVPAVFKTRSPVCVILNAWNERDAIYAALASRATLVWFDPDWAEVYRNMQSWFKDQEIYDYLYERLDVLKQPDIRIAVKALEWKRAKQMGMKKLDWRRHIDNHCDDQDGLLLRTMLDDRSFDSNTARQVAWSEETGKHASTFYRRMQEVKKWKPAKKPGRLQLLNAEVVKRKRVPVVA